MNMNKLIIREIGYDFNRDNINDFKNLAARDRLKTIFILANYSQLDHMRKALAEAVGGVSIKNILTFDDLVSDFKAPKKKYISREEGAWIIKKILEDESYTYSSSLGTAKEIFNYLLDLKSHEIDSETYKSQVYEDLDLKNLANIYKTYEDFLKKNSLEDDIGLYFDGIKNLKNSQKIKDYDIVINGFIEFRRQELKLIKSLMEMGNQITVQFPFYTKRPNRKVIKTRKDLEALSFVIDETFEASNVNLGLDIFSDQEKTFDIETIVLPAANKLEEIKQVINYINKNLADIPLDQISLIIPNDYENILKTLGKEEKLDLNIMNEEKLRSLPLISSILNFLYFVKNDEKKKLISCFYDDNLNFNNYTDKNINKNEFVGALREFDYKGLYYKYKNIDLDLKKFLEGLKKELNVFKNEPIDYLKNNFCEENFKGEILKNFIKNQDEKILSDYLQAVDALGKILFKVENFKNILNLNIDDTLDLLINYLEDENYYASNKTQGLQVLKAVNSIGINTPYKIICGLNYDYPKISTKGYLYSDKFKNFHKKLNFKVEDYYEAYDNSILLYSQTVSFAENLIFSYIFSDMDAKDSRSVLLNDTLKRINADYLSDYASKDFPINFLGHEDDDFNHLSKSQALNINRLTDLYEERKDFSPSLNGFVEAIKEKDLYFHRSEYSPKMLGYYNDCPFKYYMAYILKYESLDLDYKDSFFIDKGNIYHKVLEEFFKEDDYKFLSDEEMEERLVRIIDDIDAKMDSQFKLQDYQKEIYKNYLFAYIKKDLANQKAFLKDFWARYFEKNIKNTYDKINIYGKVDRVDLGDDGSYIIYDYKSRAIPTKNSFAEFKNIQLSLYGLILGQEKLAGISYGSIENERLANFLFKKEYLKKGEEDTEIEEYFSQLKTLVEEIDSKIQEGDFMLKPIDDRTCQVCPYGLICRKEDLGINEI